MSSKDPKYNMSEANIGTMNNNRNYSAVLSQKTAASSNHYQTVHRFGELPHQYSTAIMGGGGPNIYDRLLNDSTENLLRPTAHMIGSANRITASFASRPGRKMPSRTNTGGGYRTNARQFASANVR
eukprot:CAMPEP_0170459282 /NCGR_PEP_ID=MMETSP0123-20130129/6033_1 /TAXON_ID=182087 /ORGANISM="Favella ehrenbergii, Strain Fehren 1" /LENGTH=125 /DNA_ID=CAMNT_0010723837 /DNA_START=1487 /DNA_END=1864 /DNA_ORIENTATION=+